MAGIADMIVSSALESAQKAPDISGSITKGAELAQTIENTRLARQKLDQAKAENQLQKYSKVTDLIKIAHESKDPAIANSLWKHAIPKTVKALGTEDAFTEEFLETAAKSPETREKVLGYQLEIQEKIAGGMPASQAVAEIVPLISDPAARAALDTDRIIKAQETAAAEKQLNARNERTAQSQERRQDKAQGFTAGQADKTNAEAFSKKLVELGLPSIKTTLGKLDSKVIPGGFAGYDGRSQIEGIGGKDSLIPSGRLGKVGVRNRQIAEDLKNDYIKMMTGQGVGVEEAVRLGNSLGFSLAIGEGGGVKTLFTGYKSSADFVNGVKNLRDKMIETENTLKAGAGLNAVRYFEGNKAALSEGEKTTPTKDWKSLVQAKRDGYNKLKPEAKNRLIEELARRLKVSTADIKKELGVK